MSTFTKSGHEITQYKAFALLCKCRTSNTPESCNPSQSYYQIIFQVIQILIFSIISIAEMVQLFLGKVARQGPAWASFAQKC